MADFASIKRDYSLDFKLLNESTSSSGISFFRKKGYDLNIKNLVNVNYSTNAMCDSAM